MNSEKKTLVVDLDPQGNASTGLGVDGAARKLTTFDLLLDGATLAEVAKETSIPKLWICPANADLSSADMELLANERRSFLLKNALRHIEVDGLALDYILIDCPPSLSLLTINALVAADSVLVPLQSEFSHWKVFRS